MTLASLLSFVIDTLSLGSLYALLALGLVLVYGIMQLVNFAYGEYIMVAAFTMYLLTVRGTMPWFAGGLVAIVLAVTVGYLSEVIAFKPFRGRSLEALLVSSFAVSVVLQNTALITISPRTKAVPYPLFFDRKVNLVGVQTSMRSFIFIGTALVLLIGLVLLMKKTTLGVAMRAASENFVAARLMGVPANLVISSAFLISGFLAGVFALFWTVQKGQVWYTIGSAPLLIAFIAVVIGGMHSLPGAVAGGFVYAAIANFFNLAFSLGWLPNSLSIFSEAFMFIVVIIFLVLKPEGLIRGNYAEERVG
jgi:branched-chain amino acid transport system permease protein